LLDKPFIPTHSHTVRMVEIRIPLDREDHKKFLKIKGETTWRQVIKRGIESLAFFNEMDWTDILVESSLYKVLTDEDGELK